MTSFSVLLTVLVGCTLVLSYVYVIFPVAMSMIARRSRDANLVELPSAGDLPFVSLIIPAYNEESVIEAKLHNAMNLDYPSDRLEILIACDGPSDRTSEIASTFDNRRLRVLDFPERRGKASVINDAASQANGDVLLLCDANVMFASDALQKLVAHLARSDVGAVSGDVRLDSAQSSFGAAESVYYRMERAIHEGESTVASMMGVDGGMYVLRRELFNPVPADTILDDFTISMGVIRSGHRIIYEPSAIATENATEAAKTEYERRVRVSSGAAQLVLRGNFPPPTKPLNFAVFVSHKLLRWLSPFVILTLVVAAGLLAWQDDRFMIVIVGTLAVGAVAIAGAVSQSLRKNVCIAIPFYFVMSEIAIAHGVFKGLVGHLDPRWERTERQSGVSRVRE